MGTEIPEILQLLIDKLGYRSYLEIGCDKNATFNAVQIARKIGVDPEAGGTHRMTSDEFFRQNGDTFDIVFIDGLHEKEQVLRDVDNACLCLNPGGCVVVHDALPKTELHQRTPRASSAWTGDVWKAISALRQRADLDTATLDVQWGFGLVFVRCNTELLTPRMDTDALTWDDYRRDRDRLLRPITLAGLDAFVFDKSAA
jgi:hypothetical protein